MLRHVLKRSPPKRHLFEDTAVSLSDADRRLCLAFLEAILPGSRNIPTGDEHTLDVTLGMLRHLFPELVPTFLAAQRMMDLAAIPFAGARFSSLSYTQQQRVLPILGLVGAAVLHQHPLQH